MPLVAGDQVNSYEEELEAIQTRFNEMFDSTQIPVQYGNFGILKVGNTAITDPDDCEQFVRLSVINGIGSAREITRSFTQVRGLISINIFSKRNIGSRKGRVVADAIFPIFSRTSFYGIETEAPTLVEAPPNNSWFQINLTIPYRWNRCLA